MAVMPEGSEQDPQSGPKQGPGSRRRRAIFLAVSGVLLLAAVVLFRAVLLPFLLAIVVAYVLAPLVAAIQRFMPRWVAVLLLYMVLVGTLTTFIAVGAPRLAVEIERLAEATPAALRTVRDEWIPQVEGALRRSMAEYAGEQGAPRVPASSPPASDARRANPRPGIRIVPTRDGGFEVHLPPGGVRIRESGEHGYVVGTAAPERSERADLSRAVTQALNRQMKNTEEHAVMLLRTAQTLVRAVVKGIFTFVIMLMLSAYLLITSDRIFDFFRSLVRPGRRTVFDGLLRRIDRGLSGVVRGQLLIAAINGVLSGIGFYVIGLQYWPLLTLVATVLSVIPIFGGIISSVPAVIVALQQPDGGIGTALLVVLVIVIIHQVEANALNPKIMGDAAKVHPVLVVFALLAGEHVYGIAGALLAVPVLSICQSLFLHYREVALGVPAPRQSRVPNPPSPPANAPIAGAGDDEVPD